MQSVADLSGFERVQIIFGIANETEGCGNVMLLVFNKSEPMKGVL